MWEERRKCWTESGRQKQLLPMPVYSFRQLLTPRIDAAVGGVFIATFGALNGQQSEIERNFVLDAGCFFRLHLIKLDNNFVPGQI
jgi:hypothetical protein